MMKCTIGQRCRWEKPADRNCRIAAVGMLAVITKMQLREVDAAPEAATCANLSLHVCDARQKVTAAQVHPQCFSRGEVYLERQVQQFCVHAVLLGQAHTMITSLCFAKVVHCLCHLYSHAALHILFWHPCLGLCVLISATWQQVNNFMFYTARCCACLHDGINDR